MPSCVVEKARRRLVLAPVGRLDGGAEDQPVRDDDVALVAVDRLRAALATVAHVGVADRDHALLGDAVTNAVATSVGVRLDVLLDDASKQRERVRDRRLGRLLLHVVENPGLERLGLRDQSLQRLASSPAIVVYKDAAPARLRTVERAIDEGRIAAVCVRAALVFVGGAEETAVQSIKAAELIVGAEHAG